MTKKSKVIGVRVDPETDARLARFERETGVERVTLARNAMVAALDYFEANGRISFPLILVEPGKAEAIGASAPPTTSRPTKAS